MLTPSSNTVLEPVSAAMLRDLPEVSVHFGRFRVTEIALSEAALGQFGDAPMLEAARLLADARVDTICWNGTSAAWLGLDRDRDLCAAITATTGVSATSSVAAMIEGLRLAGIGKVGVVSPYTADVQEKIVETLGGEGFEVTAERHLGICDNFSFGTVAPAEIERMAREVAAAGVGALLVLCTNLRAMPFVPALERDFDVVVLDSVATAVWGSLRAIGVDPARLAGWGRLFAPGFGAIATAAAPLLQEVDE
ncbi:MAG: Asp/Glu/hydantoin racemase [Phyllobacteriaceae bacterium]|nr:Asp/Glu/hydantoin racemase [Phyllobacteriaceae bacterium]